MGRHFYNMFDLYSNSRCQCKCKLGCWDLNWGPKTSQTQRALFLELIKFPKFIGWFRWAIDCAQAMRLPNVVSLGALGSSKLVDDFSGAGSMA